MIPSMVLANFGLQMWAIPAAKLGSQSSPSEDKTHQRNEELDRTLSGGETHEQSGSAVISEWR